MLVSLTLIFAAVSFGLLVLWAWRKFSYFRIRNIPYLKPTFPVGCLEGIGWEQKLCNWVKTIYSEFRQKGKFGGIFIGFDPVLIPTDLNVIKEIMVTNFSSFTDHSFYVNERDDPLSGILFSLKGERWRNLRTKLSATFSNNNTRNMFETVYVIGYDMLHYLEASSVQTGKPFNAKNLAMRFICDSIGSCGFGLDCKALTENDPYLLTVAENLFPHRNFLLAFWILAAVYQKTSRFLRLKTFPAFVTNYFKEMINETVKYREENGVVRNDFMDLLIQIKNKGCLTEDESGEVIGNITYDELQAQAFVIFFAGFQTSRVTLTFALFELAVNPTVQNRVREEVRSHLSPEGLLTYESLEKMTYLQQVINETMRKYPPQVFLTRVATADHTLSGTDYTVRKGHHVYIPLIGIHYDPEIYPDPDRFEPDRMTPEEMKKRHPCSFMPFGMGPRICIGYRFGILQVKLGIAMILSKYHLTVHHKTKQPLSFSPNTLELDVQDGIWLNTHPLGDYDGE